MASVKETPAARGTDRVIGVDWGTSSFRAYLMDGGGAVLDRREAADGILAVQDFDGCFERHCGGWADAHPQAPILLAGMIGSRQGWVEAPYCPCPAGAAEIAGRLTRHVTARGRSVAFVPGLSWQSPSGADDVMRGEETQILGVAAASGRQVLVLPGTHSKWAEVVDGRVLRFSTFMTGEVFAAMSKHTILGRLMTADGHDPKAFGAGIAASSEAGGLLHHLFRVRTAGLFARWPAESLSALLSGLVIGHEIRAAKALFAAEQVLVVGGAALATRYSEALAELGMPGEVGTADAAARGLAFLARASG